MVRTSSSPYSALFILHSALRYSVPEKVLPRRLANSKLPGDPLGSPGPDRRAEERAERSHIIPMLNARRLTLYGCAGVLLLLVAAAATADEKGEAVLRAAMAKM